MQDRDFEWFIENYSVLYDKHGYCFLAIKNEKVIGVYSSFDEAVDTTLLTEEIGTFIVQECNGNESAYTIQIASMFI
ncbi:MAG: hypothetical protein FWD44_09955 [Oscillospiraceae bacterium]|nr:hypothetical protein [Oscillospiraceae bacterium]